MKTSKLGFQKKDFQRLEEVMLLHTQIQKHTKNRVPIEDVCVLVGLLKDLREESRAEKHAKVLDKEKHRGVL